MSLPAAWVDRIFDKLTLAYGHDFLRKWEGLDMGAVKADWGQELGGYTLNPGALRYALDHLPADKAPNAKQFRGLCMNRPDQKPALLPAPITAPSPDVVEKIAALAKPAATRAHPRDWARRLEAREKAGEPLSHSQREAWRLALTEAS
jgi:hypothetical protein